MRAFVEKNYLDEDISAAVSRFAASKEFVGLLCVLDPYLFKGVRIAELGAGRGLVSLALASEGMSITSVELDPSYLVGLGALRRYLEKVPSRISPVRADILQLPFRNGEFDIVLCRSVLHHLPDLSEGLYEINRVLKPGGVCVAWKEHIISPFSSGRRFLACHPAVAFGVDERAYSCWTYRRRFQRAGFKNIVIEGSSVLDFGEFVSLTHRANPIRSRLSRLPLLGAAMAQIFYGAHRLMRGPLGSVFVAEESLPVVSIRACKPSTGKYPGEGLFERE
jgi:ubiquinone/menaquinone biosynthesis C-methylase UbiE